MSRDQLFLAAIVALPLVGGFAIGIWYRREKRAFESDVEDLSLSPEQLCAKYHAEWVDGPPAGPTKEGDL